MITREASRLHTTRHPLVYEVNTRILLQELSAAHPGVERAAFHVPVKPLNPPAGVESGHVTTKLEVCPGRNSTVAGKFWAAPHVHEVHVFEEEEHPPSGLSVVTVTGVGGMG